MKSYIRGKFTNHYINYIFYFLSIAVIPIALFVPVATWIPLILAGILLFVFEKNKLSYFSKQSSSEYFCLAILIFISLSLIWTINIKYAAKFLIHLVILFISFKIVFHYSYKITNFEKVKKLLFYSLNISCFIALVDMYFYVGIKYYIQVFLNFFYIPSLNKYFSFYNEILFFINYDIYKYIIEAGMLSGLYNRGLSIVLILGIILCTSYYKNKILFTILILNLAFAIFIGESFSLFLISIFCCVTFILVKMFGKAISPLIVLSLVLFFISSPILLNTNNEKDWGTSYSNINKKILALSDINLKKTLTRSLKGEFNYILLFLEKNISIFHAKIFHRTMIWSYTINKIKEDPFIGKGLSSSRKIGENNSFFLIDSLNNNRLTEYALIPLHPHNNTLQIWLEFGFIGCILFLLLYMSVWKTIIRNINLSNNQEIFFILVFVCVFLINQVSFGLFQTWWLSGIGYFAIYTNIFLNNKY